MSQGPVMSTHNLSPQDASQIVSDEMVAIAEKLPEITQEAKSRLDRAMAAAAPKFDAARLTDMLAKRDQLLAIAGAGVDSKLTHAATGAA